MMFQISAVPTALLLLALVPSSVRGDDGLCETAADGSRSFASSLMPAVYANDPGASGSFSPTSLREAFFMVGQGAAQSDADEIRTALRTCSSDPFGDLAAPIHALETTTPSSENDGDDDFALTIANALYVDEAFPVAQSYTDALEAYWGAPAVTVDFVNDPTDAKNAINDFVSEKTRGIIPSILESDPSGDTVLFLVNALYFKAKWAKPFEEAYPQMFMDPARGESATKMVQSMTETLYVPYVDGGTYTAVSIPYQEDGYEMLVVRPSGCVRPDGEGGSGEVVVHLGELINSCLDATLADAMAKTAEVEPNRVKVTIPRFHVKWRAEGLLKEALEGLGLRKIFNPNTADLSAMSDADDAQLFVSKVAHVADVKVTEDGTEAAAATAIGISVTSMPVEPPTEFRADVPFVYAIYHKPTAEIFFAGWVNEDALEVATFDVPEYLLDVKSAANDSVCSSVGPTCASASEDEDPPTEDPPTENLPTEDPPTEDPPVEDNGGGQDVNAMDDTSSASVTHKGVSGIFLATVVVIAGKLFI